MATTPPISLKTLLQPPVQKFVTSNEVTDELQKLTGKNIHELMAEAIHIERNILLATGASKDYYKLLTTVFGKFAVGAPIHQVIDTDPTIPLTRDEIQQRIDNFMTRKVLSTPIVADPAPNSEGDTQ